MQVGIGVIYKKLSNEREYHAIGTTTVILDLGEPVYVKQHFTYLLPFVCKVLYKVYM
jgi:hypothetical protein